MSCDYHEIHVILYQCWSGIQATSVMRNGTLQAREGGSLLDALVWCEG